MVQLTTGDPNYANSTGFPTEGSKGYNIRHKFFWGSGLFFLALKFIDVEFLLVPISKDGSIDEKDNNIKVTLGYSWVVEKHNSICFAEQ